MSEGATLKRVYATTSQSDAYAAKGRLESEGIPVLIKGGNSDAYPVGPVYLWVPEEAADMAEGILAAASTVGEQELEDDAMSAEPEDG